jgi:hypothetical protein
MLRFTIKSNFKLFTPLFSDILIFILKFCPGMYFIWMELWCPLGDDEQDQKLHLGVRYLTGKGTGVKRPITWVIETLWSFTADLLLFYSLVVFLSHRSCIPRTSSSFTSEARSPASAEGREGDYDGGSCIVVTQLSQCYTPIPNLHWQNQENIIG